MKHLKINLLGATGSIGTQVLDVCRKYSEITINSAAAGRNIKTIENAAREFGIKKVCIADESLYNDLKTALADTSVQVLCGTQGLCELASDTAADMTVNSVVGAAGLLPTEAAIKAGIRVALANKETLVAGGSYIMGLAAQKGVDIIPIDSEHSAIFQSLLASSRPKEELKKIILTASGGPFFGKTAEELETVTREQALAHPNWSMGSKITIDSATLMNKGFELIEACHLFSVAPDKVEIVIHRQSVIHSAVEFCDNAVIAQLGTPDMTIPIQLALTYPERYETTAAPLSLTDYGTLTFARPDTQTFGCLRAAQWAAENIGTTAGAVINGANEVLVAAFLDGSIGFGDITRGVLLAAERIAVEKAGCTDAILAADRQAREYIRSEIKRGLGK